MNVVVQKSPLHPPLLDVRSEAMGTVQVYDDAGALIFVLMVLPGAGNFVTCDARDPDFRRFVVNAGLKLSRLQ